jgi:hypothetical protein
MAMPEWISLLDRSELRPRSGRKLSEPLERRRCN